MIKAGIDQDAVATIFSTASAKQGENLRRVVCQATLKALQGRELTLENIRRVLKAVAVASTNGLAANPARAADMRAMLSHVVQGMDAALLKAVQANRTALQQFMDLGVGLQNEQMKTALANLERMEEVFVGVLGKVMQGATASVAGSWDKVLQGVKHDGTNAGAEASQVVARLMAQSHAALIKGRAANVRAAQAMMDNYAALVSGVMLGLSEGMAEAGKAPEPTGRAKRK